ncbi:hypothetical protein NSA19_04015 [Actinomyces bowdenii]|uniref:hypothetical protein n=1 Tax=Actinomyces bowdenii TaxID=131109 RepID=UPI00214C9C85|nr:hypothetical protein [Actinomyces bowdenii]MCR2052029.1 hypothetical protein [Actinomyces bowdenii]
MIAILEVAADGSVWRDPAWRDPAWLTAMAGMLSALMGPLAGGLTGRRGQGRALGALAEAEAQARPGPPRTPSASTAGAVPSGPGPAGPHEMRMREDLDRVQEAVARLETSMSRLDSKVDVLMDMVVDAERHARERDAALRAEAICDREAMITRIDALEAGGGARALRDGPPVNEPPTPPLRGRIRSDALEVSRPLPPRVPDPNPNHG